MAEDSPISDEDRYVDILGREKLEWAPVCLVNDNGNSFNLRLYGSGSYASFNCFFPCINFTQEDREVPYQEFITAKSSFDTDLIPENKIGIDKIGIQRTRTVKVGVLYVNKRKAEESDYTDGTAEHPFRYFAGALAAAAHWNRLICVLPFEYILIHVEDSETVENIRLDKFSLSHRKLINCIYPAKYPMFIEGASFHVSASSTLKYLIPHYNLSFINCTFNIENETTIISPLEEVEALFFVLKDKPNMFVLKEGKISELPMIPVTNETYFIWSSPLGCGLNEEQYVFDDVCSPGIRSYNHSKISYYIRTQKHFYRSSQGRDYELFTFKHSQRGASYPMLPSDGNDEFVLLENGVGSFYYFLKYKTEKVVSWDFHTVTIDYFGDLFFYNCSLQSSTGPFLSNSNGTLLYSYYVFFHCDLIFRWGPSYSFHPYFTSFFFNCSITLFNFYIEDVFLSECKTKVIFNEQSYNYFESEANLNGFYGFNGTLEIYDMDRYLKFSKIGLLRFSLYCFSRLLYASEINSENCTCEASDFYFYHSKNVFYNSSLSLKKSFFSYSEKSSIYLYDSSSATLENISSEGGKLDIYSYDDCSSIITNCYNIRLSAYDNSSADFLNPKLAYINSHDNSTVSCRTKNKVSIYAGITHVETYDNSSVTIENSEITYAYNNHATLSIKNCTISESSTDNEGTTSIESCSAERDDTSFWCGDFTANNASLLLSFSSKGRVRVSSTNNSTINCSVSALNGINIIADDYSTVNCGVSTPEDVYLKATRHSTISGSGSYRTVEKEEDASSQIIGFDDDDE